MTGDLTRRGERTEAAAGLHGSADRDAGVALRASRRDFLGRGLAGAGLAGAGLVACGLAGATRVMAKSDINVQALQTAMAIENVVIEVYTKATSLPASVTGATNPVVQAFLANTLRQHRDHAQVFGSALTAVGGAVPTGGDAVLLADVVTPALGSIKGPGDVVTLALKLEDIAAQTFTSFAGKVDASGRAFTALAGIAPVEAQHVAVLLAFQGLLLLGAPELIQIPAPIDRLPAAAGDMGFPHSFYPTSSARALGEEAAS